MLLGYEWAGHADTICLHFPIKMNNHKQPEFNGRGRHVRISNKRQPASINGVN